MLSRTPRSLAYLRIPAARPPITVRPSFAIRLQQQRFSSSHPQPQAQAPEGSLNNTFFKTFGRPIAKVFLLAIFTYQVSYYFWVRAEQDETRSEMRATIADLEARIEQLEKAK
ncbi:hypothetical protein F4821DRAFT_12044 [Hypoxylon rubiginosum]|uniref:Uncharacterized protein n=1 Tax=Hypoxylon rubiginosum TaxID=110542 RepID=A0ACC0DE13_9PEZI|nr:hypothetical protein F4821DRAFT_12044 [Hypoxylon rubiginosum]